MARDRILGNAETIVAFISDKLNIDVWQLIQLANKHPRVNILQPGPGVSGHCIAVDPWFIVDAALEEARLIRTAREVHDNKPARGVAKVKQGLAALKNQQLLSWALRLRRILMICDPAQHLILQCGFLKSLIARYLL
ncbi:MAG: hypothetical protein JKY34_03685 [Kordiimonadaceae bacterium]|nr:hypothetical protein [Kordiimonadaceae bacterium]